MDQRFVERYLERGKQVQFRNVRAGDMNSEQLLALVGYLAHWALQDPEATLDDLPSNDGLDEG